MLPIPDNVEAKGEGTTNMAAGIAGMAYYGADIRGCPRWPVR
jgi:hypothetical protein